MYVVIEGSLGIYTDLEMNDCVVKLFPSAVVGERAFQNNESTRSKSCKAECPSKCLVLSKEDFICKI